MSRIDQNILHRPLSHPVMNKWDETAFDIPEEAARFLEERYSSLDVDCSALINAVRLATMHATFSRKTHEVASLTSLDLNEREAREYANNAGKLALAGENVVWFAEKAARAFTRPDNSLEKISLELGGNRQYGMWGATKEVDDIAWQLYGQLKNHPAVNSIRSYEYDAVDTPIKYRFWPQLGDGISGGNVRRRRGLIDSEIETAYGPITVKPFKQARGVMLLDLLDPTSARKLLELYTSTPLHEQEDSDIENAADRYAGQIFRSAIQNDANTRLAVVPNDAVVIAVAHRPTWASLT